MRQWTIDCGTRHTGSKNTVVHPNTTPSSNQLFNMPGRIKSKKTAHSKTPYSRPTAKPPTKRSKPSAATKHANDVLRDELDSIFATEQSDLRGVSVEKKDTRGLVELTRNQERERKIKEQQDLEDMLSLMEGGFGKAADLGTPVAKRPPRLHRQQWHRSLRRKPTPIQMRSFDSLVWKSTPTKPPLNTTNYTPKAHTAPNDGMQSVKVILRIPDESQRTPTPSPNQSRKQRPQLQRRRLDRRPSQTPHHHSHHES
ncbi:hypothetical protein G7K_0699-t1 [Saitoella complicata NRRL Y-17804]|uniref:Uncharacterized protein n=1 Tax=Saitoella complicata (strain BCRC 22490 / CBS 7301 / JCM 7358 / NBRC 10748 / NRRL Y-17804) TaxID=698492 RepID=A0A0E9N9J8_SAICN|nr:hypothetical protein G7K_0699-t1 [Saitoella complicata NRRL Y-17804]